MCIYIYVYTITQVYRLIYIDPPNRSSKILYATLEFDLQHVV